MILIRIIYRDTTLSTLNRRAASFSSFVGFACTCTHTVGGYDVPHHNTDTFYIERQQRMGSERKSALTGSRTGREDTTPHREILDASARWSSTLFNYENYYFLLFP